jgi:hypothetical protein
VGAEGYGVVLGSKLGDLGSVVRKLKLSRTLRPQGAAFPSLGTDGKRGIGISHRKAVADYLHGKSSGFVPGGNEVRRAGGAHEK